jgi:hypothetical protein
MGKPNAMLAKRDALLLAGYQKQLDIALQMGLDAAMIAANLVFQLGKGRAADFGAAYMQAIHEISELTIEDSKDDPELVYSREKLDQKIKAIVGDENFEPYEERYSMRKRKGNK